MGDVLESWIYPPIRGLEFKWHQSKASAADGIASILVPEAAKNDRPYVVAKVLDEGGRRMGVLLGYFERVASDSRPMSVEELRSKIKDGMRFDEIYGKLRNVEEMVGQRVAVPQPSSPLDPQVIAVRIGSARLAAGLNAQPVFWLAAWPLQEAQFEDLFQSREAAPVQLLEHPPRYRYAGFDVATDRPSEIIQGRFRRCLVPGRKILELWQDSLLAFVAHGGDPYLAWAMHSDAGSGLRINNIALAETAYSFSELAIKLFTLAKPNPTKLKMQMGLSDMRIDSKLMSLSRFRPGDLYGGDWRQAPTDGKSFEITFPLADAEPGVIAYCLLAKLYTWFGFEESQIPYVAVGSQPPRINLELIAPG